MDFRESEIGLLREGAAQRTARFLNEMRSSALQALRDDLAAPERQGHPDEYVLRANAIALGMADAGALELAHDIYVALDEEVLSSGNSGATKRHRGTLLANQAILNVHLRRYDEAVPTFVHLAQKIDPETFGVAPEDSHANVLRRQAFDDPAVNFLLTTWSFTKIAASPPVSRKELEDLAGLLGEARLVLYAALLFLRDNIQIGLRKSAVYTALRLLDSLRVYAFQLEEVAGRLATVEFSQRGQGEPSIHTLVESLKALFCGPVRTTEWWPRLQGEIDANGCRDATSRLEAQNERLKELAERQVSEWSDIVVNSLAVLHLVRNIAAHEIYPPAYVITAQANLERVLGWLTMSGVALHREVFRA